jgi:hypothetical protein
MRGWPEQGKPGLMSNSKVHNEPVAGLRRRVQSDMVDVTRAGVEVEVPVGCSSWSCGDGLRHDHQLEFAAGARKPAVPTRVRHGKLDPRVQRRVDNGAHIHIATGPG